MLHFKYIYIYIYNKLLLYNVVNYYYMIKKSTINEIIMFKKVVFVEMDIPKLVDVSLKPLSFIFSCEFSISFDGTLVSFSSFELLIYIYIYISKIKLKNIIYMVIKII